MNTRIYVGNLPPSASEEEVRALFSNHGTVTAVRLASDESSGRTRGYGFVEMDGRDAPHAIERLSHANLDGRTLAISAASSRL